MLDEETLRLILLVLLTLLCFSVVRILRKRYVRAAPDKNQAFKGQWVRNKHVRSEEEAEFLMREAIEGLSPSLNLMLPAKNEGAQFQSYFSLLRLIMRHARMAYLATDKTKNRIALLKNGGDQCKHYQAAVQRSISLQTQMAERFMGFADQCLTGSNVRKFLLESHKKFIGADIGKRSLVISRINQDLDCVDIRHPNDPNQVNNTPKLIQLYKQLSTLQSENEVNGEMIEKGLENLQNDPCQLVTLNLAFAMVASDKFQLESGFIKQQVMVAFYGTGLDKNPEIAEFHAKVKKSMKNVLYGLGEALESALADEMRLMVKEKVIRADLDAVTTEAMMEFGDYCAIGALAVKYSSLKGYQDQKQWDQQRRKLIKRKSGKGSWAESEISNEYAQFVVAQSLAETNHFEVAIELCYKALGISMEVAEKLFKHHVLLEPEQRETYAKVLQAASEQLPTHAGKDDSVKITAEQAREALFFLAQAKVESIRIKDEMVTAHKQKTAVGEKVGESGESVMTYFDAILKVRAYDLLALELGIEKATLNVALIEHGNVEAIKSLLAQI